MMHTKGNEKREKKQQGDETAGEEAHKRGMKKLYAPIFKIK
jgi:hypothetical protein